MKRLIASLLRLRLVRAYLTYSEHRGPMLADSVTYRALFSIFAAVLLGFSVAVIVLGGNPEAMRALSDALDRVIPGLSDIVDPESIRAPTGYSVVGALSTIGLIAAAIGAIGSLRAALRVLSDQLYDDGFFLWVYLRNFLVGVGFAGLLAVAAGLSVIGSMGLVTAAEWIGITLTSSVMSVLLQTVNILIIWAVDTVAVAFIFRMLSGIHAPARALWGGAMLGAVGLVVLQTLSGLFVRGATANPLLATFAVLIALLLWINLSVQVVLIASTYILTITAETTDRIRETYGAQTLAERRLKRAEDRYQAAKRELRAAQDAQH